MYFRHFNIFYLFTNKNRELNSLFLKTFTFLEAVRINLNSIKLQTQDA